MTRVNVDPDGLDALARRLRECRGDLEAAASALRDADPVQLGDRELARALDHFAGHWRHGLGRLGGHADQIAGGLIQAAASYRECDDAVARACRGHD